ncbi:hypothetical protein ACLOJK_008026 [Asimina triloba]
MLQLNIHPSPNSRPNTLFRNVNSVNILKSSKNQKKTQKSSHAKEENQLPKRKLEEISRNYPINCESGNAAGQGQKGMETEETARLPSRLTKRIRSRAEMGESVDKDLQAPFTCSAAPGFSSLLLLWLEDRV